jgi:multimeric flavodoxin WrbA
MALNVLGISTSPRDRGNSDLLVREALRGAGTAGAACEYLSVRDLTIGPCVECYACAHSGVCRVADDFQPVFDKMLAADRLVFATPVFFMAVCAQAKLIIDRCQCLWSRKYLLRKPLFPEGPRDRRAMVIAVGGTKSKKMFECLAVGMRCWFGCLEAGYFANLFVNQVDERGDILKHPRAMAEAFRLGASLADPALPLPKTPETVELFGPAAPGRAQGEVDAG